MQKSASLAAIFISLLIGSCQRKSTTEPQGTAGKGGNAVLRITPQHHSKNIDSATIYIKYNAKNTPSGYDDSAKCVIENGKPVAVFSQLKKGDYYLLGRGWDPSINNNVIGGIPYSVKEESSFNITVPVTEGD